MKAVKYKTGEREANAIFLLVAVFFLVSSFFIDGGNYPAWSSAKIVPILLSTVMVVCALLSLLEVIRVKRASQASENVFQLKVLLYIGAYFLYVVALFLLPFWLASVVFLMFSFLYWKSLPVMKAAVTVAATVAISMILFAKVFKIAF